jgi:hypothetical protein
VSCAEDETDCPDHIAVAETNNCHNFQFSIPVLGENQIIHWSFDGSVPVGGGHSISHEFVENGDHQVCVTYSSSHCTEGVEICETVHVGCKGVEWHLYPNPATWALTVMSTGEGMIEHIVLVSVIMVMSLSCSAF